MTTQTDKFTTATQVGTGATDLATTTTGEKKIVWSLSFTNTSVSAVLVTLYNVDTTATETAGSGGNWLADKTIQPGKVWSPLAALGSLVLGPSQTLSATAATGSVINANCAGSVET